MHSLCDLSSLGSIRIDVKDIEEDTAAPEAISAIATSVSLSDSQIWDFEFDFEDPCHPGILPFEAIRPLFGFQYLQILALANLPPPSFDDAMLSELAQSFSDLRKLKLHWITRPQDDATHINITFWGFTSLLRHCIELCELEMAVDAIVPAGPVTFPQLDILVNEARHTHLRSWTVFDSRLCEGDVEDVFHVLSRLTPNLRDIILADHKDGSMGTEAVHDSAANWKKVDELLEQCRMGSQLN
ncbi:hypothetical protein CONPUDRAFT_155246 [Coniophora puteana RWD-64-598 SS2]|uniref:F-box domain-containing protein n=1 Tax=Coniophora puteana (strain RWD-64-598) TaxID=741705 RepID=A0A5M3ML04_CONPW|nr:uncharacterized protein CONPUDRAFT_155246 [Coniophora puteana RWD-64-598 SS2]EIW79848.1 hypothetical protein CONPUDRAFT_155246 [Coniophora puteana RWD-64-598 SS2]